MLQNTEIWGENSLIPQGMYNLLQETRSIWIEISREQCHGGAWVHVPKKWLGQFMVAVWRKDCRLVGVAVPERDGGGNKTMILMRILTSSMILEKWPWRIIYIMAVMFAYIFIISVFIYLTYQHMQKYVNTLNRKSRALGFNSSTASNCVTMSKVGQNFFTDIMKALKQKIVLFPSSLIS